MTRQDSLWVAIRSFGIYLLVNAIFAIPAALSSTVALIEVHNFESKSHVLARSTDAAASESIWHTLEVNYIHDWAGDMARLAVYTIAAVYMLRNGKLLFKWINPPNKTEPPVP